MKALIDLDPLVYQYGSLMFTDGNVMPGRIAEDYLLNKIEKIVEGSGATHWEGFLTFGPDNFRKEVATIREYKGNRKNKEKPPLYDHLRSFLTDFDNVTMAFGQEADDLLSMRQWDDYEHQVSCYYGYIEDDPIEEELLGGLEESLEWQLQTIICSPDKDLNMVPGWHYRWGTNNYEEIKPWKQTKIDGLRCFYKQCILGDDVDNIPGLYGIGERSKRVLELDALDSELRMAEHVLNLYRKYYGNYAEQFLTEVGRLLWMRTKPYEMWEIPNV